MQALPTLPPAPDWPDFILEAPGQEVRDTLKPELTESILAFGSHRVGPISSTSSADRAMQPGERAAESDRSGGVAMALLALIVVILAAFVLSWRWQRNAPCMRRNPAPGKKSAADSPAPMMGKTNITSEGDQPASEVPCCLSACLQNNRKQP